MMFFYSFYFDFDMFMNEWKNELKHKYYKYI